MSATPPEGGSGLAKQLLRLARFTAENLGPMIVFIILSRLFGTKLAIAGTILYCLLDIARRYWKKLGFPKLYLFSTAMTVGFGAIDLLSNEPFMLRFEPAISNFITFALFVYGSAGKRSLILEIVEEKRGAPFIDRPDIVRFCIYLTLIWAVYFLVKALFYLYLGLTLSLELATEIRAVVGPVSLAAMIGGVSAGARPLYHLFNHLGLLPPRPVVDETKPGSLPA